MRLAEEGQDVFLEFFNLSVFLSFINPFASCLFVLFCWALCVSFSVNVYFLHRNFLYTLNSPHASITLDDDTPA